MEFDNFYSGQPAAVWNGAYYEVCDDMVIRVDLESRRAELCPLLQGFDSGLQGAAFWHAGPALLIQSGRVLYKLDLRSLSIESVLDVPQDTAGGSMGLFRDGGLAFLSGGWVLIYSSVTKAWERRQSRGLPASYKALCLDKTHWVVCSGGEISLYDTETAEMKPIYSHAGADLGACYPAFGGPFLFVLARSGQLLALSDEELVKALINARRFSAEIKRDDPVPRLRQNPVNTMHPQCAAREQLPTEGPAFITAISMKLLAVRQQKSLMLVDFATQTVVKSIEMPEFFEGHPAACFEGYYFEVRRTYVLRVQLDETSNVERIQRVQIVELPAPTSMTQTLVYDGVVLMNLEGKLTVLYLDTLEWRVLNQKTSPDSTPGLALMANGMDQLSLCGDKTITSYNIREQEFTQHSIGLNALNCKLTTLKDDSGLLLFRENHIILTDTSGSYQEVVYSADASIARCNSCIVSKKFLCVVDARGVLLILEAPQLLARVQFDQTLEIKFASQESEK